MIQAKQDLYVKDFSFLNNIHFQVASCSHWAAAVVWGERERMSQYHVQERQAHWAVIGAKLPPASSASPTDTNVSPTPRNVF